jgi:MFS family permease
MAVHGRDETVGAIDAQILPSADDLIAPPPRSIAPADHRAAANRRAHSTGSGLAHSSSQTPNVALEHPAGTSVPPAPDRRYITAALLLVMVLASMEQTVTSTAMPTIIGDLHGLEHYSWVASIYLLACTVSMPLYGRLADALGRKPVILAAIGLFLVASGLAGAAHSMTQLIIFRGLQGLGAGGIMPVVLTILGDIFTLKERARIQGVFSAVWGSASLAGPWLGAHLVLYFGWRSVFYVNFPLSLLGLIVLVWKYRDHEKPHSTDLDLPGAVALAIGCMAVLALVSRLGPDGWSLPAIVALITVSVTAITYFIRHERRAANPIMPPDLMTHRLVAPALIGSLLLGVGFLSLDTFVPLYVQGGRGGDASAAANVVTPVMLTWALSGIFAAPLVVRWGFRRTALLGSSIVVAGFVGLIFCAYTGSSRHVLTAILAVTGLGFGPASMSYLLAAQGAVDWQRRGVVTSSVQFYRTIGGAVGIGVLGAMFNAMIAPDLARLSRQGATPAALLDPRLRGTLPPALLASVEHALCRGLLLVFIAMLVFAVLQVVFTLMMSEAKCDHRVSKAEALEAMAG